MTKSTGDDWLGVPASTHDSHPGSARRPALMKELGVTQRTVYKLLDEGQITSYKIGRVIRIKRADLDDFLERVKVRPGDLAHLYPPGEDGTRRESAEGGPGGT